MSSRSALIWIASLQGNWLLVFDNADGAPEVVEKVIPSGSQGNILVTSRNQSLGCVTSYENSLEIDQMAEKEAISLLLKAGHLTGLLENVYSIAQQIEVFTFPGLFHVESMWNPWNPSGIPCGVHGINIGWGLSCFLIP